MDNLVQPSTLHNLSKLQQYFLSYQKSDRSRAEIIKRKKRQDRLMQNKKKKKATRLFFYECCVKIKESSPLFFLTFAGGALFVLWNGASAFAAPLPESNPGYYTNATGVVDDRGVSVISRGRRSGIAPFQVPTSQTVGGNPSSETEGSLLIDASLHNQSTAIEDHGRPGAMAEGATTSCLSSGKQYKSPSSRPFASPGRQPIHNYHTSLLGNMEESSNNQESLSKTVPRAVSGARRRSHSAPAVLTITGQNQKGPATLMQPPLLTTNSSRDISAASGMGDVLAAAAMGQIPFPLIPVAIAQECVTEGFKYLMKAELENMQVTAINSQPEASFASPRICEANSAELVGARLDARIQTGTNTKVEIIYEMADTRGCFKVTEYCNAHGFIVRPAPHGLFFGFHTGQRVRMFNPSVTSAKCYSFRCTSIQVAITSCLTNGPLNEPITTYLPRFAASCAMVNQLDDGNLAIIASQVGQPSETATFFNEIVAQYSPSDNYYFNHQMVQNNP